MITVRVILTRDGPTIRATKVTANGRMPCSDPGTRSTPTAGFPTVVCSRAREDLRSDSDTSCRRFMAAALTTSPCPVPASRETVAPAGGADRQYNRRPVAADAWRTLVAANAPATAPKRRIVLRMDAAFRPLGCAQTTASHKRGLASGPRPPLCAGLVRCVAQPP